jgi:predicted transcriptional regulator
MNFEVPYKTKDKAKLHTLAEVTHMSRGLTIEEVLAQFGMDEETFLALEDEDFKRDFRIAFIKGRSLGKREAVDKLFNQMGNSKGGHQSILAYLSRFGEKWSDEEDSPTGFTMSFGRKR